MASRRFATGLANEPFNPKARSNRVQRESNGTDNSLLTGDAPLMIIDSQMAGHLPLVAGVSVAHVDVSVLDDVLQGFVGVIGRPAE